MIPHTCSTLQSRALEKFQENCFSSRYSYCKTRHRMDYQASQRLSEIYSFMRPTVGHQSIGFAEFPPYSCSRRGWSLHQLNPPSLQWHRMTLYPASFIYIGGQNLLPLLLCIMDDLGSRNLMSTTYYVLPRRQTTSSPSALPSNIIKMRKNIYTLQFEFKILSPTGRTLCIGTLY